MIITCLYKARGASCVARDAIISLGRPTIQCDLYLFVNAARASSPFLERAFKLYTRLHRHSCSRLALIQPILHGGLSTKSTLKSQQMKQAPKNRKYFNHRFQPLGWARKIPAPTEVMTMSALHCRT